MRLICLNTWGGKKFNALMDFIKKESLKTDIFCFQEVLNLIDSAAVSSNGHTHLYDELKEALPGFNASFAPLVISETPGQPEKVPSGNAIFWKKEKFRSASEGNFFPYGGLGPQRRGEPHKVGLVLYEKLEAAVGSLTIANFHGIATWPKTDTNARLEQSENIIKFLDGVSGPKILCGDFNEFPDTKGIAVLGHTMKNLIREFGVKTTRSKFLYEEFKGEAVTDNISDYVFVSPDVRVDDFSAMAAEVSDHLPLILDFSV